MTAALAQARLPALEPNYRKQERACLETPDLPLLAWACRALFWHRKRCSASGLACGGVGLQQNVRTFLGCQLRVELGLSIEKTCMKT